jgi:phenylalanine-4-hydroxylase
LGGAVLSSVEESSIALGSKAKIIDFDLKVITNRKYRSEIQYTGIQPFYVLSPPIDELCTILDKWVDKLLEEKTFISSYNPQTRQIEVT